VADLATATELRPGHDVERRATVVAHDVHVTYRVYEDRRPRMREILASGLRRPSYREIKAVRGVTLTAREGEAIGLIGRNGSGKSSLLQALAGLLPVTGGAVFARSQPSLLGVSAALQPNVSGRRNIVLGGLALGMSRDEVETVLDDTIAFTGLAEFIDLPIRTYSSGMRARLHFAIATMVQPEILLIDEALSVGDQIFRKRSQKRIERLRASAGTVFLVSHSLSTVADMCNRCLWLDGGRLLADGEPDEVIAQYQEAMDKEPDE
jgi:teichoic acid transport system ATP-binding protein